MRLLAWAGVIGSCVCAGAITSPVIGIALLPLAIATMLAPAKKRQHR